MMLFRKRLFLILGGLAAAFLLDLFSCQNHESHISQSSLPKYEIRITDSLELPVQGVIFVYDYLPEQDLYLASLSPSEDVLMFNSKAEVMARLQLRGSEPGYFGGAIKALSFMGDSSIIVLARRGFYTYSLSGEHQSTILHPTNAPYNFGSGHDLTIIDYKNAPHLLVDFRLQTVNPVYDPRFYQEAKLFTVISIQAGDYEGILGYRPDGLYRSSNEGYISNNSFYYAYDKDRSLLWTLSQSEPKLRAYHIGDSLTLEKTFMTEPEFLPPAHLTPFGSPPRSYEEAMKRALMNGKYRKLWKLKDTLVTIYDSGADPGVAKEISIPEYQAKSHRLNRNYFQLLVNGKRICRDLPMPLKVRWPMYLHSTDRILFMAEDREFTQEPEGARLYVGGIYKAEP